MAIELEIVTPEAKIFGDQVDDVIVPGFDGEMNVLVNHTPLVTTLIPGELRYRKNGEEVAMAVGEGILEITAKRVAVLTDLAVDEKDIDEAVVEEALQRAKDALAEKVSDEDIAAVEATILKSLAQLNLKRRRRRNI
jgi:F-type H+-transporting ATPase subunit epsilon